VISTRAKPSGFLSGASLDGSQKEPRSRDWVFNLNWSLEAQLWSKPVEQTAPERVQLRRVGAGPPCVHIPASSSAHPRATSEAFPRNRLAQTGSGLS